MKTGTTPPISPRHQRGAALYIALILLIVLSLLGIAGVRVASMQERMSAAWRATNVAFQASEARIREREIALSAAPNSNVDDSSCQDFDPGSWAEGLLGGPSPPISAVRVARVESCGGGGTASRAMGMRSDTDNTDIQFQVSAFSTDQATVTDEATAESVVDTIFIP